MTVHEQWLRENSIDSLSVFSGLYKREDDFQQPKEGSAVVQVTKGRFFQSYQNPEAPPKPPKVKKVKKTQPAAVKVEVVPAATESMAGEEVGQQQRKKGMKKTQTKSSAKNNQPKSVGNKVDMSSQVILSNVVVKKINPSNSLTNSIESSNIIKNVQPLRSLRNVNGAPENKSVRPKQTVKSATIHDQQSIIAKNYKVISTQLLNKPQPQRLFLNNFNTTAVSENQRYEVKQNDIVNTVTISGQTYTENGNPHYIEVPNMVMESCNPQLHNSSTFSSSSSSSTAQLGSDPICLTFPHSSAVPTQQSLPIPKQEVTSGSDKLFWHIVPEQPSVSTATAMASSQLQQQVSSVTKATRILASQTSATAALPASSSSASDSSEPWYSGIPNVHPPSQEEEELEIKQKQALQKVDLRTNSQKLDSVQKTLATLPAEGILPSGLYCNIPVGGIQSIQGIQATRINGGSATNGMSSTNGALPTNGASTTNGALSNNDVPSINGSHFINHSINGVYCQGVIENVVVIDDPTKS